MICQKTHRLFKKTVGNGMRSTGFIVSMRLFVCMLNICPVYIVNTEAIEWMNPEMNRTICKLLLNVFCGMALLSYWIACLRKPKKIPAVSPRV